METISLTVPHKEGPLRKAADMLTGLADDCALLSKKIVSISDFKEGEVAVVPAEVSPVAVAEVETPAAAEAAPAPVPVYVMPGAEAEEGLEGEGLDDAGLPWDVRINASTKTTLAKTGAWKLKRGVDPAFVEQIKAELRAAQEAATVEAPVVTETPVVTEPAVVEVPAPPVVVQTAAPVVTFESICQKITARANAQLLKTTDVPTVLAPHGLTNIGELATRGDLFVTIDAALDTLWATTPL